MSKEIDLSPSNRSEEEFLNFASIQDVFVGLSSDPVDSLHTFEAPHLECIDFLGKISVGGPNLSTAGGYEDNIAHWAFLRIFTFLK